MGISVYAYAYDRMLCENKGRTVTNVFFFMKRFKKTRDFCERTDTSQIVYRIEYFYYYSVLQ